ncbi:MAG: ribonuclease HII [Rhodospirillales bacterium]
MPDFELEDQAGGIIAGVDEAGRGPWAGPVVAGAVILDRAALPEILIRGLDDSKKLSAKRRAELFHALKGHAKIGVGIAEVAEIDALNILQATMLAMTRAVGDLGVRPSLVLVDGNREPALDCPVRTVIGGDGKSMSIAAASIVAKVTRDRVMAELALEHPGYGWERNSGYGTKEHSEALQRLGVSRHHRKSFKPIIKILRSDSR